MKENHDIVWNTLKENSNLFEQSLNLMERKQTGSYYTALDYAYTMMNDLADVVQEDNKLFSMSFLEPCVGTGNFVFAFIRVCKERGIDKTNYEQLLNNIYMFAI